MKKEVDYYNLLGVSIFASQEQIKAAYIAKIKEYHPDTYKGNKEQAENIAASLNDGYAVLSDEKQKLLYDEKFGFEEERQRILREKEKQQKKQKRKREKNYTEERYKNETAQKQQEFNNETKVKKQKIKTDFFTKKVKKNVSAVHPHAKTPEEKQLLRERLILDITIISLLVILIVVLIFK